MSAPDPSGARFDEGPDVAGSPATPHRAADAPYRAALVKRRPVPAEPAPAPVASAPRAPTLPPEPSAEQRAAALREEHGRRVQAEVAAVRRIEAMTRAWNDELASTVPAVAAVVSRAVRQIVGEAPREDVVVAAARREMSRVRGEHRPTLRVARADGEAWVERLRARAAAAGGGDEPLFAVRPDDALAPGKCVLEMGARRADLTPEAQLDAFDDALRNGVGALPPRPAPALPEVESARRSGPGGEGDAAGKTAAGPAVRGPSPSDPSDPPPAGPGSSGGASSDGARSRQVRPRSVRTIRTDAAPEAPSAAPEAPSFKAPSSEAPSSDGPSPDAPDRVAGDGGSRGAGRWEAAPTRPTPTRPAPERPTAAKPTAAKPTAAKPAAETPGGPKFNPPKSSTPEPAAPEPITAERSADDLAFDDLELGEGAARYETAPPPEAPGDAPWVGTVVSAPDLAAAGLGGSRAVAALRERVARTAVDLRREAGMGAAAEAAEPPGSPADGSRPGEGTADARPAPASASDRHPSLVEADGSYEEGSDAEGGDAQEGRALPSFAPASGTSTETDAETDAGEAAFPPFARARPPETVAGSSIEAEAGDAHPAIPLASAPDRAGSPERPRSAPIAPGKNDRTNDGTASGEATEGSVTEDASSDAPARRDPIATGGGEAVRRAIAGARRRAARPPSLAAEDPAPSAETIPAAEPVHDAAAASATGRAERASRLPPRIAALIAARRGPRS